MDRRALLRRTMALARTGDQDAFENFYILTVEDTFGCAYSLVRDELAAEDLLEGAYVMFYRNAHELPLEPEPLREHICDELFNLAHKKYGIETEDFSDSENCPPLPEERAASLWMQIEEKAGMSRDEPREERGSVLLYLYSSFKIALTAFILAVTVLILYVGFHWFQNRAAESAEGKAVLHETAKSESEPVILEEELQEPGWERKPDGKLYYVKKDGIPAEGAVAIGKQLLTFSRDGELTLIGSSKDVAENPNYSFEEETRFEVRGGDLYRKDPDAEELCVVRNGHIVQADARCGFLWYISKYQIPNSEQVRTVIYRSDMDGEREEEIYSTENILESEMFQLTGRWLYYLSEGGLFRKELETGMTEFLAENVEYYFAWEDTAYYMNARTLESVSAGHDYSGVEAGYRILLETAGFVIYDASLNPVEADSGGEKEIGDRIYTLENGVIRSVRPADRRDQEVTYYIDEAGEDRKIYWESENGSRGLIMQEGLAADSLCIAGEWLYYSARIAQYGGEIESQIYRVNLQSMELEKVGVSFRGYMRNLYYFDGLQRIFGEYIPSLADAEDIHGNIAVLPIGGELEIVNDAGVRPPYEGSDMLELVMADGNQIYCLYHQFQYDGNTGEMVWTSTEPLVIKFRSMGN